MGREKAKRSSSYDFTFLFVLYYKRQINIQRDTFHVGKTGTREMNYYYSDRRWTALYEPSTAEPMSNGN
eukprot:gene10036-7011_t